MFSIRFKDGDTDGSLVLTHEGRALDREDLLAILDGEPPLIPLPGDALWPAGSVQLAGLILQLQKRATSLVGPSLRQALIRRKINMINNQLDELEGRRRALRVEAQILTGENLSLGSLRL